MALRGWRLVGVASTMLVYIGGILLLSVVSLNSPNQRRPRTGRFGEFDAFRRNEVNMVAKRQPLRWCQTLRYLGQDETIPPRTTTAAPSHHHRAALPFQGLPPEYFRAPIAEPFQESISDFLPKPPEPSSPSLQQHRQHQQDTSRANTNLHVDDGIKSKLSNHQSNANYPKANTRNNDDNNGMHESSRVMHSWPKSVRNINQKITTKRYRQQSAKDETAAAEALAASQHNLIALASFPGSGNTWLRYLLQQATGIYTGSVYKDFGLLKSGFPAENVYNSSVLVVKTHEWGPNDFAHYAKAILLVRDPDKAILAEFNRQSGGHVGFASPDRYRRTKGRYWQQFVENKLRAWEEMNTQWAHNFTGAVHIVYYDDLVADVESTLRGVLDFIQFPTDEAMLHCAISRKEGIYRRKKRILTFDPYSLEMHTQLELKKRQVYSDLGRYKF